MAYLQEIKITEDAPAVGSIRQPNTIFIVPITDKTCDMYASDNDGIVRATSVQVPVFNSVEEANSSISPTNRFEGKTVIIKNTYSKEIPVLDEEGEPVLETISTDVYFQYWWRNGIEDENLISFAPPISSVLENGNEIPSGKELVFISGVEPNVPPEFKNVDDYSRRLSSGYDGTNFFFNSTGISNFSAEDLLYNNFVAGISTLMYSEGTLYGTIVIGGLNKHIQTSGTTSIGSDSLGLFNGVAPSLKEYTNSGSPWGLKSQNVALGYWAGFRLREGAGNVFIGSKSSHTDEEELWNTLVINSDNNYNVYSNPERGFTTHESHTPLIYGKFDEKWLEIGGKLRLRPTRNKLKKDGDAITLANAEVTKWQNKVNSMTARLAVLQTRKDENAGSESEVFHDKAYSRGVKFLSVFQSELTRAQNFANQPEIPNYREDGILTVDTTDLGEVVVAKKTDFILDVIREMSPEQLTELKTILGVTTEPEPEV